MTVAPGDNLSLIFSRLKLSKSDLHTIVQLDRDKARLRRLRPGQLLRVRADESRIESLVLELDELNSFRVERTADGSFALSTETVEPEVREASTAAVITRSLFLDAQQAGLDDATIMRLTDIFGWDIDFALDIREGDRFSAIYEEIYKDGEMIKQGRILAAEFINRGRRLRAVWFTNESGESAYYSDEGHAMRKAFLRTPVNFTRISSRFNLRRKHPVLNTIRAHRGVDYAAPLGTPVRSTANGKIRSVGRNGGYGRVVEIQHGKSYRTLYAHLSRFAKGLKRGSSVRQGQVIGYVGKSGLATGPHLHYEFRVNGHHRNPLTVDLPKAQPIDGRYLDEFKRHAQPFLQRLAVLNDVTDETSPALVASLDAESLDGEARTPRQN
ncbi:MAG: OapA family protein [Gammaproteobacteria bacterium]